MTDTSTDTGTEAAVIRDLTREAYAPTTIKLDDGRTLLVTHGDATVQDVSDQDGLHTVAPRYISKSVTLQTQDSLVDYVQLFKGVASLLFADIERDTIVGQVDYHAPTAPAHLAHRATLVLPKSEEWKLWTGISGRLMPQLEFARFIEENAPDVRAPSAGELLEAVRDLQAHRKVNFIRAVRTASDNENFEFTDETTATSRKSGLELPTKFVLGLPVYFGEPDTEVHAFLRWTLDDGKLLLGIQLNRVEHVRQAVFKQIVLAISDRTGVPALYGRI
ncbi:DUF2303 family protein [Rhodoplanes roseus]|uniref:DUF2303 domain-containing protein n=1 Tax=Rhodoplanes roseus TaxID=29409 RepID=A0A327KIT1_9BRAD|nr:DUF2303 family protein [Rhodoplanes roseus]RAI37232.1 hypothetical protein CH341_29820 [Rhodoplanes roseus]